MTSTTRDRASHYKRIVVPERGGPEVLQVAESVLRAPASGEVRVNVLAAPVSKPDVEARHGYSPFAPDRIPFVTKSFPFVPGYAIVGVVDAVGDEVTDTVEDDQVAALTVYGGYSEYVYLDEAELIPVPVGLDPVEVAPLILNYLVAYQTLHRSAQVEAGDTVLVIGASGGIGTAYLQLGQLAGLTMYGVASKHKHSVLKAYGATPIDYRTQDVIEVMRAAEPNGIDAVFDGIGGDYVQGGYSLLQRGGTYVGYANPGSLRALVRLLGQIVLFNMLPDGKSATVYGTGKMRLDRAPFVADWATLFELLKAGWIDPIIARIYPLDEAADANELLESGDVVGNVVLVASEPME